MMVSAVGEEEAEVAVVVIEDMEVAGVAEAVEVAVIAIIKMPRAISVRTWIINNLNTPHTGSVIRIIEVDISEVVVVAEAEAEEMKVIKEILIQVMVKIMVRITISSHIIPAKEILTGVTIEVVEIITMRERKAEGEEEAAEFKVDGIRVQIAINVVVITEVDSIIEFILLVFLMIVEAYCTELP